MIASDIEKLVFWSRIRDMWRLIKKWWFLKHLGEEITRHTLKSPLEEISQGKRVLLSQHFFIEGDNEYPGLAKKSLKRFSWLLWWHAKDNPEKLKRKINDYNDIFETCIKEGYIEMRQTSKGSMPEKGSRYDEMHGIGRLLQNIGQVFNKIWYLLGAIITFIIGKYWDNIVHFLFG